MSNHQMAQHSRGRPRKKRGARQTFEHKQNYRHCHWKEEEEPELHPPQMQQLQSEHQKKRTASRRNRNATKNEPDRQINDDTVAPMQREDELDNLYKDGPIKGSLPILRLYGQNYDFSTFPLLCECTYRDLHILDSRISWCLPFSVFLHGCTMALNARLLLLDQDTIVGLGDGYNAKTILNDITLPGPIAEYLSRIGKTSDGANIVNLNIPEAGIPLSDKGEKGGTFGELTAENHNAYECYVSPRVTRRRVEASIAGNADWTPLDPTLLPQGFVANKNFLGYGYVDNIQPGITELLTAIKFPSYTKFSTFATRIQYSPQIVNLMNYIHQIYNGIYEIGPAPVECGIVSHYIGCIEVIHATPNDSQLAEQAGRLLEPTFSILTELDKVMSYTFGFIRKRSLVAPGLCGTVNGEPPDGWIETRNYNHECVGIFALGLADETYQRWTNKERTYYMNEPRDRYLLKFIEDNFRI